MSLFLSPIFRLFIGFLHDVIHEANILHLSLKEKFYDFVSSHGWIFRIFFMSGVYSRHFENPFAQYRGYVVALMEHELIPACQRHLVYLDGVAKESLLAGREAMFQASLFRIGVLHSIMAFMRGVLLLVHRSFLRIDVLQALPMSLTDILTVCTSLHSIIVDLGYLTVFTYDPDQGKFYSF